MAAAMGADEYGFGSVAMIATGCVMARIYHTNNCPVGVASQREELRARFPGVPGDLVIFFLYVAEENVGLPKWSSTKIRLQDAHSNGPVLDDVLLSDPEGLGECTELSFSSILSP
ncbi:hypothetical protein RHMOL_Rhmol03G0039700 [Rhododendron molle]|uniref:Uncharacterized protein n=1 Tax=Rhododendron molle TaxID=49168 RepID=A0ACC0PAD8_RHOML|nr:hypothetical protein RHMOL_Rhmol03G0039700 [Rhododendron molle]